MQATYRLNVTELTEDFIKALKSVYPNKDIEITVQETDDETEYLMKSEANKKELLKALEEAKKGKSYRTMSIEEMEAMIS